MKFPDFSPQFSVRRAMIAVAIVACLIYVARLAILSSTYQWKADEFANLNRWTAPAADDREGEALLYRRIKWARDLSQKYEEAAQCPWLPVAADPPEPE